MSKFIKSKITDTPIEDQEVNTIRHIIIIGCIVVFGLVWGLV